MRVVSRQKEYGDFQTPDTLATEVVALVSEIFGTPGMVVEPTCGVGAFLRAGIRKWGDSARYAGYEINAQHLEKARELLAVENPAQHVHVKFSQCDFFTQNWAENFTRLKNETTGKILVLGNPPWATNSMLSQMESQNLPPKNNFQRLRGFDARTGKSNFDIAEWMLLELLNALPADGVLAMLCKTATARKVLRHVWKTRGGLVHSRLFRIDAAGAFDVAVDACLFVTGVEPSGKESAVIHESLALDSPCKEFGLVNGGLVSDLDVYHRWQHLDGCNIRHTWRSGVKHDAADVMEFRRAGGLYENGLGEKVALEEQFVYPLLKSSDIGNARVEPRKFVLIPQTHVGASTSHIGETAPQTWAYLNRHQTTLQNRRSSIYQDSPSFSIFGIGDYSFAPWKIAVSGFYKSFRFALVSPWEERPVMLDDTCYFLPCQSKTEAVMLLDMLNSKPAQEFLQSIMFIDGKRPLTVDVLRRLSLTELARELGRYNHFSPFYKPEENSQLMFVMESPGSYKFKEDAVKNRP